MAYMNEDSPFDNAVWHIMPCKTHHICCEHKYEVQLNTVSSDLWNCIILFREMFFFHLLRPKWVSSSHVAESKLILLRFLHGKLSHIYTDFTGHSEPLTGFIQGHSVPLRDILCNNVFW